MKSIGKFFRDLFTIADHQMPSVVNVSNQLSLMDLPTVSKPKKEKVRSVKLDLGRPSIYGKYAGKMRQMYYNGIPVTQIAEEIGCTPVTVYKYLNLGWPNTQKVVPREMSISFPGCHEF